MSTPVTPQDFAATLSPDVPIWYNAGMNQREAVYPKLFNVKPSDKAWETLASHSGLGYLQQKGTNENLRFDKPAQGPATAYSHTTYGIVVAISQEMIDDQRAFDIVQETMTDLGDAVRRTDEFNCASVINGGHGTTLTGPDGKALFATDHPTRVGTISNILTNASDFNYGAMETMYIQMETLARDDRGNKIDVKPAGLVSNRFNSFNIIRAVETVGQPGTANNDVNAVRSMGMLTDAPISWDYLTTNRDWYMTTTQKDKCLLMFTRKSKEVENDTSFQSKSAMWSVVIRNMQVFQAYRGMMSGGNF